MTKTKRTLSKTRTVHILEKMLASSLFVLLSLTLQIQLSNSVEQQSKKDQLFQFLDKYLSDSLDIEIFNVYFLISSMDSPPSDSVALRLINFNSWARESQISNSVISLADWNQTVNEGKMEEGSSTYYSAKQCGISNILIKTVVLRRLNDHYT